MKRHDESISDRLRRMAATDELKVGRGRAEQIAARALARAEARPHRRARLVAAIVSGSAFAIVSATGVGAVADHAVPGDSLYPVDRAYESISRMIGRDVDRTEERIDEAIALAERGDRAAAADHVTAEFGGLALEIDVASAADDAASVTVDTAPPALDSAADQASAAVAVESADASQSEAAVAGEDTAPIFEEDTSEVPVDPFLLALENALRATRAAAETEDDLAAQAAEQAVQSVVRLAAEFDRTPATDDTPPEDLAVDTTTSTAPEGDAEADDALGDADSEEGTTTSTVAQAGDDGSTTTTVRDDSETEPPGDGETAGDDSGGSQEGSGSAGEPGDDGEPPPGPVFIPIP